MRLPTLALALCLALFAAVPARAALPLPVRTPGSRVPAPCIAGDVLEVRLSPSAARASMLRRGGITRYERVGALGVPDVDALAAALGGATFEPEFAGEAMVESPGTPDFTAFQIVHLPPGADLESALARFRALPSVTSADPIAIVPVAAVPNDSLFVRQLGLYQPANRRDARAPEAWDLERGDTSITVAIIDTGVLPYHPDLGGRGGAERGQIAVNATEANGLPGVDDDGNGFVDDMSGWDFVNLASAPVGLQPGEDWGGADNDPNDYAGHGTLVAGIVGAIADNGIGPAGVAWNVRLLPVRIAWATSASPLGELRMDFAAAAIRYATRMGAQVINCSFGSVNTNGIDAAVAAAARAGVTVVVASGNNGQASYLATREDVIAVCATDSTDAVTAFSNRSAAVDLAANGVQVPSTFVTHVGADSIGVRTPSYTDALSGTSFAAPQVAGAVALLQAQRRRAGLDPLTPMGALLRVRETADDISAQNPGLPNYGTGRLDLARALGDGPRSLAIRAGARTSGPSVVVRRASGPHVVFHVTTDRRLLGVDGATGDTVSSVALPAAPAGALAAADLGGGRGVGLFIGTNTGRVAGYRPDGTALPGWPALGPGGAVTMTTGPVVGDIDGDGAADVLAGSADGRVWAWRGDGALIAGWPFDAGAFGASGLALGDVDSTTAGREVLLMDAGGTLHALAGVGAAERWATFVGAATGAPVVTRFAGPASPLWVLVATGNTLQRVSADGAAEALPAAGGNLAAEPTPCDLDGDGRRELLVPIASPAQIELRDSAGVAIPLASWPRALPGAPTGAPLVAPSSVHATGVFAMAGGQVVALDRFGTPLAGFPKPGAPTGPLTLADLVGDDRTRIVAGSSADSTLFTYDAGPATWDGALATWPTARGNCARTGDATEANAPPVWDDVRPARVADVRADLAGAHEVTVHWTSTGDDSLAGTAALVEVRRVVPNDVPAVVTVTRAPAAPGQPDSARFEGLAEGVRYEFDVTLIDDMGQRGAPSNVATVDVPALAPAAIADLRVIAATETTVTLRWTATGGDGSVGRPARYRVGVGTSPLDSLGFALARQVVQPATVDAGGVESCTVGGLERATLWWFALVAEDDTGARSGLSNGVSAVTGVGGALRGRNGPAIAVRGNPARRPVVIDWMGAAAMGVASEIHVFDATGRLVRTFPLGTRPGGTVTWDGRDAEGSRLPAGLYFARLRSGSVRVSARLALVP